MFDLLIGPWCQFYIIDSPVCSAKFIKWQTHLILKFERVCDIQFSKQQTGLLNTILKIYRLFWLWSAKDLQNQGLNKMLTPSFHLEFQF